MELCQSCAVAAAWQQIDPANRPSLCISHQAEALVDDFHDSGVPAVWLPELIELEDPENDDIELNRHSLGQRARAIEQHQQGALLVGTPRAVNQAVPRWRDDQHALSVQVEQHCEMDDLAEQLIDAGFRMVTVVEHAGEIAVRGGLLRRLPPAC